MPTDLPTSAQDYLKAIWTSQEWSDEPVTSRALAERVGHSPSTVSETLKKLRAQGLVVHERYGRVDLTDDGRAAAVAMVRRHRLVETFLVDYLGYAWDEVHDEAEVLEHAVSEKVLVRMDELLGHPAFDPHGDPIPDAMGKVRARKLSRLDECRPGQPLRVSQVENSDPAFLRFAESRGLTPGAALTIQEADPMSDALMVQCDGGTPFVVGMSAARRVFVSPAR